MKVLLAALALCVVVGSPIGAEEAPSPESSPIREAVPLPLWEFKWRAGCSFDLAAEDDGEYYDMEVTELEALLRVSPDDLQAHLALARMRDRDKGAETDVDYFAEVERLAEAQLARDAGELEPLRILVRVALARDDHALARRYAQIVLGQPGGTPWDHVRSARIALSQVYGLLGVSEEVLLGLFSDFRVDADPETLAHVAELFAEVRSELAAARAIGRLASDDALAAGIALEQLLHGCLVELVSKATGRPNSADIRQEVLAAWREAGSVLRRVRPDEPGPLVVQALALLMQLAPRDKGSGTVADLSLPLQVPARVQVSLAPIMAALRAQATGGGEHAAQAAGSLAGLHFLFGELDSAEEYAAQSVDKLPPGSAPWALLCILLGTEQRHAELEPVARRWLRAESTLDGYWALAKALAGQGRSGEALEEAQHILALDALSPESHLLVAALQLRLGAGQGKHEGTRERLAVARGLLSESKEDNRDARVCLTHLHAAELALSGDAAEALTWLRILERRSEASEDTGTLRKAILEGGAPDVAPVAWVGDVPIDREEVLLNLGNWAFALDSAELERSSRTTLRTLIRQQLLVQVAQLAGVDASVDVVNRKLAAHLAQAAGGGEVAELRYLDPEAADDACVPLLGFDAETARTWLHRSATTERWVQAQLLKAADLKIEGGRVAMPQERMRALWNEHPKLRVRPRQVRGALWRLAKQSPAGPELESSEPSPVEVLETSGILHRIQETPSAVDAQAVAHRLGIKDGNWCEFESAVESLPPLAADVPEVTAWLRADDRSAGDTCVFQDPSGLWLAAVLEVHPGAPQSFEEGAPQVFTGALRAIMSHINLETLLAELSVPGRVRPADLEDALRDELRSELEVLVAENGHLLSLAAPKPVRDEAGLPLAVFSDFQSALAEAAASKCPVFLLVEPDLNESKRQVADETLIELSRHYIVAVVSGRAGDPQGDQVRKRYGLPEGGPHALALASDGRLLLAGLPLDPPALHKAMKRATEAR